MSDNIETGDFSGAAVIVATTDTGGVHTPHHRDPEAIAALAAILAKILAAPATEAKQDTQITGQAAANVLLAAATPAGESHIGSVGGNTSLIDVTLSLDTGAYATGDVMADTQVVTNAMRVNDGTGVLQSIEILDEDDQGLAFDLVFLSANRSIGTENSPVSISDANARDILGGVSVAITDYLDLGGCKIATLRSVGLAVKAASGTPNLYVAAVARGAPTYSASGVKLRLGFLQD